MPLTDSARPFQATITAIRSKDGFLSVRYSADSSYADSNTPDIIRNFLIPSSDFTDSAIQNVIKDNGAGVLERWDGLSDNQVVLDSSGFNDSGYAGTEYEFTYKPRAVDTEPSFNPQTQKISSYDSEGPEEVRTKYNVVSLTAVEKREYRETVSIGRQELWDLLNNTGNLVKVHRKLGSGDDVSASWDASAGAAFDFSTDGIASYGVNTVERVAEGTYRVVFTDAYDDANYTVTTGVGAENYGGAGASPRQLTVISRAADSLQVHCERTDDAVDEDNAYMAVQVSKAGSYDSAEIEFLTSSINIFGSVLLTEIKSILGYTSDSAGDSDLITFITQ
jgi:hypothetical protein